MFSCFSNLSLEVIAIITPETTLNSLNSAIFKRVVYLDNNVGVLKLSLRTQSTHNTDAKCEPYTEMASDRIQIDLNNNNNNNIYFYNANSSVQFSNALYNVKIIS